MDETGMAMRRDTGKARHVPWANVPRGRGGEVGELIGRPMWCTLDRRASAVKVDGRLAPWSRVLDSMDLTPLVLPLVPLPAAEVAPGVTWTVTGTRPVQLSHPWGKVELESRTEVSLVGFEQHEGREAARLAFEIVAAPVEARPRFTYELSIKGDVLLGLDGAILGGEAAVTLAAAATVVDAQHELAGTGTVRFNPPQANE